MKFILIALATMVSCNGGSSTERMANRVLNGAADGIAGSVDKPVYLTFADEGLVVDVVIENASGDVIVRGKPKEATGDTAVRIEPRFEIAIESQTNSKLNEIEWDVHMDPNDRGGQTLTIDVRSKNPEAWFAGSDIEVDTARLGTVTIHTKRGKIIVDDNRGPTDLSTIHGEIRVRTPWPMTQPCAMVTAQASISWCTRGESTGEFDCETVGGNIISYCRYGRWIMTDKDNDTNSLHATLNGGTNPIIMRTVDGDIRITIVEDPHNTGSFHWP